MHNQPNPHTIIDLRHTVLRRVVSIKFEAGIEEARRHKVQGNDESFKSTVEKLIVIKEIDRNLLQLLGAKYLAISSKERGPRVTSTLRNSESPSSSRSNSPPDLGAGINAEDLVAPIATPAEPRDISGGSMPKRPRNR